MAKFKPEDCLVLIVDDTSDNLYVLTEILDNAGYNVTFAKSGKEALNRIKKIPIDLIILDLMMPEMDGIEVCSRIKMEPGYQDVPIIFLTAFPDLSSLKQAFQEGAVDYLRKPVNTSDLLDRVQSHLINRQAYSKIQSLNAEIQSILES